jgi:hypothetical protein
MIGPSRRDLSRVHRDWGISAPRPRVDEESSIFSQTDNNPTNIPEIRSGLESSRSSIGQSNSGVLHDDFTFQTLEAASQFFTPMFILETSSKTMEETLENGKARNPFTEDLPQGDGPRREIRGESTLIAVHADSGGENGTLGARAADGLAEDAGNFSSIQKNIIGPLDARLQAEKLLKTQRKGEARKKREPLRWQGRPLSRNDGKEQARSPRRLPDPASKPSPTRILISGNHDCSRWAAPEDKPPGLFHGRSRSPDVEYGGSIPGVFSM